MEAANMFFHNKENQNNIQIRFTRDSVSMGDDCMAPHESKMLFGEADTCMDLLNAAVRYIPPMKDYKWEVMCDAEVLGNESCRWTTFLTEENGKNCLYSRG